MGRELFQSHPVFASSMVACDRYLKDLGSEFSLIGKQHSHMHVYKRLEILTNGITTRWPDIAQMNFTKMPIPRESILRKYHNQLAQRCKSL